jgi:hypothetical protein
MYKEVGSKFSCTNLKLAAKTVSFNRISIKNNLLFIAPGEEHLTYCKIKPQQKRSDEKIIPALTSNAKER